MAELLEHTAAARRRRETLALVLLALVIVLLIITISWWRSLPDEDLGLEEPIGTPITLTGAELMAAYEEDPGLIDFAESPLLITAPLATTPSSGTTVLLETADPLRNIAAQIDPADAIRLTDFEPGLEVSLQCERIAPGLRAPSLEGCSLIPDRQWESLANSHKSWRVV